MPSRTWSCSMGKWPKHFEGNFVDNLLITRLETDELIKQLEKADSQTRTTPGHYESDDYSDEVRISYRYHRNIGKLVIVCNLQLEEYVA